MITGELRNCSMLAGGPDSVCMESVAEGCLVEGSSRGHKVVLRYQDEENKEELVDVKIEPGEVSCCTR